MSFEKPHTIYIVFDQYYLFNDLHSNMDRVYYSETEAKKRVEDLNKGKHETDAKSYYLESEIYDY